MHRMLRRFSAAAMAATLIGPWSATYAQSPQAPGPFPSGQGGTPGGGAYPFGYDVGAGPSGPAGGGAAAPYPGESALAPPGGAAGALGGGGAGTGAAPGMEGSPLAGGAPGLDGG